MQAGLSQGDAVPAALEQLARPHLESFDNFLSEGIHNVVHLLEPVEVCS